MSEKTLDVVSSEDANTKVSDVQFFGNPDMFKLLCKASSKSQGWMKSSKACQVEGGGCIVQVTTQQGDNIAEALTYVPNCVIETDENGVSKLVSPKFDLECCAVELQESPNTYLTEEYTKLQKSYCELSEKYTDLLSKYADAMFGDD
jgi:hypothetical protein